MSDARTVAVKMLLKMEDSDSYSNILLDAVLNENQLEGKERAFAAALFYGAVERRLTLDHVIRSSSNIPFEKLDRTAVAILRAGLYQLLYMPSVPESAAVNESVKLCKRLKVFSAQGFVNAMLRSFIRGGKRISYSGLGFNERLSVEYSCPLWLVEQLLEQYGEENTRSVLSTSIGKPPVYIRVNTLKTTAADLIKALAKEKVTAKRVEGMEHTLMLDRLGDVEKSAAFRAGLYHVQDISSQLCCQTLRPVVNETVLDVCAAPGGKSFTMAQLMGNNGRLYSLDLHDMRVGLIEDGAQRLGIRIISVMQNDAAQFNEGLPMADRVLCDVPCSGFGVIRRKPEIKYKDKAEVEGLPAIQRQILETSSKYVKVGGTLVYSTCTLNRAENDEVAEWFAQRHPEFAPIVQPLPVKDAENSYKRTFFPSENGGDGFFTASFRRIK